MSSSSKRLLFLSLLAILLASFSPAAYTQVTTHTGNFPDGATYVMQVPANWNGTLFLYSHGYVPPGSSNPARDVGDPATGLFMLSSGFALAGSSYAHTGWALQEALLDQIAVLDIFKRDFGTPSRTIAWGHSLGGIVTAGLIQRYPDRFDAALPMCGVLSGGVATWNTALDSAFAFKTLLAPGSGLEVVHIADPVANLALAEEMLAVARNPRHRAARVSLWSPLSLTALAGSSRFLPNRRPRILQPGSSTSSSGRKMWIFLFSLLFARNWSSVPRATPRGTRASITERNLAVPSIKPKCLPSINEQG